MINNNLSLQTNNVDLLIIIKIMCGQEIFKRYSDIFKIVELF